MGMGVDKRRRMSLNHLEWLPCPKYLRFVATHRYPHKDKRTNERRIHIKAHQGLLDCPSCLKVNMRCKG